MSLDSAYKMHLHDKAELITAADECVLQDLLKFIKPESSLLGKWLDGDGSASFGEFSEFKSLRRAHEIFYSIVMTLGYVEDGKEHKNFSSALLNSQQFNSASLAIGVAANELKSAASSLLQAAPSGQ